VGALKELHDEGKVRHIGVSNVTLAQLEVARGIVEVASAQNRYSVTDRHSEDVLEGCEREGTAFIPWFPLGAGRLAAEGVLDEIARSHDATPYQVALAWLLARSPNMIPIPGTKSLEHLEENVAAAEIELTPAEIEALNGLAD
jgi:aryl-alcohol dehydrogenase-like predicted oxidoreductase